MGNRKERTYSFDEFREEFMPGKCRYCGGSGLERPEDGRLFAPRRRCRPCDGSGMPGVKEAMEEFRKRRARTEN